MRFQIDTASNKVPPHDHVEVDEWGNKTWSIEISSLEQLLGLASGKGLIIGRSASGNDSWDHLTIYDGYVE